MKKFIPIYVISIILLCSFSSFSQAVSIEGRVLSAQDYLPISEVNILIKGTTVGTSTDNNGNYQINNVKLPCEIEFSHLNYFTQNRKLSKKDIKNGKIYLNIYLNEKIQTLDEFVVTDNKLHLIASDIMDYDLNSSNIFVLKNKNEIDLYNLYGYMHSKNRNETNFNLLSHDSKNNITLANKDSASYFIVENNGNNGIYLKYNGFDSIKEAVKLIVKNPAYCNIHNKQIDYYHYNQEQLNNIDSKVHQDNVWHFVKNGFIDIEAITPNGDIYFSFNCPLCYNNKTIFRVYYDTNVNSIQYYIVYFHEYGIEDWLLPTFNFNDSISDTENNKDKEYIISEFEKSKQEESRNIIEKKKLYLRNAESFNKLDSPKPAIFKLNNKDIYIFNFYKKTIYHLDEDFHLINQITMEKNISYTKNIIFNEEGTKCYMVYNRNIKELDLSTGKYVQTIKLALLNTDKIKIVGDNIYYISNILQNNGIRIKNLYRQEM